MEDLNELKQKVSLLDYIKQSAVGKIERVGSNEYRLNPCPVCGSKNIDTIQRITCYLVGTTERWNNAKRAELRDRVTHIGGDNGIKGAQ